MIHLAKIGETFIDYPDPENIAVIVFTEGCSHGCKGCQSPSLQKQDNADSVSKEEFKNRIIDRCKRNNTKEIVFSGGDPLYHSNSNEQLLDILDTINYLETNDYHCCVYTGYYFDEVMDIYNKYGNNLKGPTFLKCGEYEEESREKSWGKTDDEFLLVSKNQYFMKKMNDPLNYKACGSYNKYTFN